MISIIDYKVGNIFSIQNALKYVGYDSKVINSKGEIEKANSIILPGVGAFDDAIRQLKDSDIFYMLKEKIESGIPTLGICLGMQVLANKSEEGTEQGLGLIDTDVMKFRKKKIVPHMGWNKTLYNGSFENFYFVHSYYLPITNFTTGVCSYGEDFSAIIEKGNLIATQFHPEKSGKAGLRLLKRFGELV
jgi:glutamine amidotransferase